MQHRHEQSVQHDVGDAGGNGDVQAQLRPFRRHQKALEGVLQHIGDQAQQDDTSVADAHRQHGLVGAQQPGHRREKGNAADGEHGSQPDQHIDQKGEDLVGTLFAAGSQVYATSALPPVPSMKPTAPNTMRNGIMRFTAAKASEPTKLDTKTPSTTA